MEGLAACITETTGPQKGLLAVKRDVADRQVHIKRNVDSLVQFVIIYKSDFLSVFIAHSTSYMKRDVLNSGRVASKKISKQINK